MQNSNKQRVDQKNTLFGHVILYGQWQKFLKVHSVIFWRNVNKISFNYVSWCWMSYFLSEYFLALKTHFKRILERYDTKMCKSSFAVRSLFINFIYFRRWKMVLSALSLSFVEFRPFPRNFFIYIKRRQIVTNMINIFFIFGFSSKIF
jgi:hypothetical protein